MALSVDYLYSFIKDLMRKNQAGGLRVSTFELLWNDAQGSYQDDLLGRFQLRNNGKTGLNTGLIEDETIMQKLSPFTLPTTLSISSGIADRPSNLVYRLALRINNKDVYKINHNQIATVKDNVIDAPSTTTDTYYFIEYGQTNDHKNGYYSFLPNTVTTADLDYIITPPDIKWGYDYDSIGNQRYQVGLSVQPLWDNNSCREITKRMLKTLGVSFKDADFVNFGQSVELTGE